MTFLSSCWVACPVSRSASVEFDNRGGVRVAVDHLVSQGHRRIGFIGYAPVSFTGVNERLSGYRDALAAAGIPLDERLVCFGDFNDTGAGFARQRDCLNCQSHQPLFSCLVMCSPSPR